MNYEILNQGNNELLKFNLQKNEPILAEAGSMMYMGASVKVSTPEDPTVNARTLSELISNAEEVKSKFECDEGGTLCLAPSTPGSILKIDVKEKAIIADGMSFLASGDKFTFTRMGSLQGMLWGAGLFLEKVEGEGELFLKSYGSPHLFELGENDAIEVDTGHLIAFEETMSYTIRKPESGRFDQFAAGEWIVTEFKGPGKIWLSSRNRSEFAKVINKFLPKKK